MWLWWIYYILFIYKDNIGLFRTYKYHTFKYSVRVQSAGKLTEVVAIRTTNQSRREHSPEVLILLNWETFFHGNVDVSENYDNFIEHF